MSKQGVIYKLHCPSVPGSGFYVGMTGDANKRFTNHAQASLSESKEERNLLYLEMRKTGGVHKWQMDILEHVAFDTRADILRREQFHMDILKPTLNRMRAFIEPSERLRVTLLSNKVEKPCRCGKKISSRNMARHCESIGHINRIMWLDLEEFILS